MSDFCTSYTCIKYFKLNVEHRTHFIQVLKKKKYQVKLCLKQTLKR